jgi:hypothetical protein
MKLALGAVIGAMTFVRGVQNREALTRGVIQGKDRNGLRYCRRAVTRPRLNPSTHTQKIGRRHRSGVPGALLSIILRG